MGKKLLLILCMVLAPLSYAAAEAVNINTADQETLVRELRGIGAKKAQAIIKYRTNKGEFKSVDELLEIKGIGPAMLKKLRDQVTVE